MSTRIEIMDGTYSDSKPLTHTRQTLKKHRGENMSMRGEIISREYNRMAFVQDNQGKEFACYAKDVQGHKDGEALNNEQK